MVAILGEAAPGFGNENLREIENLNGGLVRVVCEFGDDERAFTFGPANDLLWVGQPAGGSGSGSGGQTRGGGGEDAPDDPPDAIAAVLARLLPELEIGNVFEIEDAWDSFEIEGEADGAKIRIVLRFNGEVVEFEIDRDWDGIGDAEEREHGWNPEDADSDGDLFPDIIERDRGGNPGDAAVAPRVVGIRFDAESKVIVVSINTFHGHEFFLQAQELGGNDWVNVGEALPGNGLIREFAVPADGFFGRAIFRAGIKSTSAGGAGDVPTGGSADPACNIPASLVGRQMLVNGGKRLCFKSPTRGEIIVGTGADMMVTPFAYTFRRSGRCEARVTLVFSTLKGFETTVYRLSFAHNGAGGSTGGAFIAREFEQGELEDAFDGNFTISMNP